MIDVSKLTQAQIRQLGIEALTKALGPAGMGLFMHQFQIGSGDYTRDRDEILGNSTVAEIVARIKQRRISQVESSDVLPKVTSIKTIDVSQLAPAQIRQLGIEALTKALGSAGMARFMQQFEIGSGDYTRDRDQILGDPSIEEIFARIENRRHEQQENS
jgi:predicted XRE-type DNA-binding protein